MLCCATFAFSRTSAVDSGVNRFVFINCVIICVGIMPEWTVGEGQVAERQEEKAEELKKKRDRKKEGWGIINDQLGGAGRGTTPNPPSITPDMRVCTARKLLINLTMHFYIFVF